MGTRLESFPHQRLQGRSEFKLRVGDCRVLGANCWLSSTPNGVIISALSVRDTPANENERRMKKRVNKPAGSQMRAEYDFSRGVRGKYARRFAQGTNVVVLESDVAKVFPSSETVNSSLRALAGIIRHREKVLAK